MTLKTTAIKWRKHGAHVLILGLALSLAACGGSNAATETTNAATQTTNAPTETTSATGDTTSPTATDEECDEIEKITAGISGMGTFNWWMLVAQDFGIAEENCLELEWVGFPGISASLSAVISGDIDFATAGTDALFAAQNAAPNLRWFGTTLAGHPFQLIVSPDITSYDDLRGGAIGSTGLTTIDFVTCRMMLLANGLELDEDYSQVSAGPSAERIAALQAGTVQGTCQFYPATQLLVDEGLVVLDTYEDYEGLRYTELMGMVANADKFEEDHDTYAAIVRTFVASAEQFYNPANRDRIVQLLVDNTNFAKEHVELAFDEWVRDGIFQTDARVIPDRMLATLRISQAAGIEDLPAEDDLDWRYDNSFADLVAGG